MFIYSDPHSINAMELRRKLTKAILLDWMLYKVFGDIVLIHGF